VKAAWTSYSVLSDQVARSAGEAASHQDAHKLLLAEGEPAYRQLRETIQTEFDFNRSNADAATQRINLATSSAKTAIFIGLVCALVLAIGASIIVVRAIDQPLSQLVGVIQPMSSGNFSQRLSLNSATEFETLANGFNTMADSLQEMIRR